MVTTTAQAPPPQAQRQPQQPAAGRAPDRPPSRCVRGVPHGSRHPRGAQGPVQGRGHLRQGFAGRGRPGPVDAAAGDEGHRACRAMGGEDQRSWRAAFTLATARRIEQAVKEAQAHGEPVIPAIQKALDAERRWYDAHLAASRKRADAGAAVDNAAAKYGTLLGWKAVLDKATTPGCRKASGSNFRVDDPPVIEGSPAFPGSAHPHCRCIPVKAYRGAPVMPGLRGPAA